VGGVECDAHIGTPEEVCDGVDFETCKCELGPFIVFFSTVAIVVIGCSVGGRGVLVSTYDALDPAGVKIAHLLKYSPFAS
jgi:hypothetical protein